MTMTMTMTMTMIPLLQALTNASKCKQMQTNTYKCKQMQANISNCKQMQRNASKYKQMQMIKIKIMTLVATMTRTTSYLITSRIHIHIHIHPILLPPIPLVRSQHHRRHLAQRRDRSSELRSSFRSTKYFVRGGRPVRHCLLGASLVPPWCLPARSPPRWDAQNIRKTVYYCFSG